MSVWVRRGIDRFSTRETGRHTRHSFSFGEFFDPDRVGFGPIVALNDELLARGAGYDAHQHADVVLVTWVVDGELVHEDQDDRGEVLGPGHTLVTRAGTGLTHSERAGDRATRFVQTWLRPDDVGGSPEVRLGPVVSPEPGTRVRVVAPDDPLVGVAGATLDVVTLGAGDTLELPETPRVLLFVATGALTRSSLAEPLAAGDAFEITPDPEQAPGAQQGPAALTVTAAVPTQLLLWTFDR